MSSSQPKTASFIVRSSSELPRPYMGKRGISVIHVISLEMDEIIMSNVADGLEYVVS